MATVIIPTPLRKFTGQKTKLEVEGASAVEWQRAILEGYRAFRMLKDHRGGFLTIDTAARTLRYLPAASRGN